MTSAWQRRRSPDEVPTPIAVAVSDFCRRAGAQASPAEIREALSVLSDDEDFRVRALTDGEPSARPLGPWAVVDVLRGTSEEVASIRQTSGYYELARELVQARARPAALAPSAGLTGAHEMPRPFERAQQAGEAAVAVTSAPVEPSRPARAKKAAKVPLEERIAPKKRPSSPKLLPKLMEEVPALAPASTSRREAPRPKGRFATVEPQRRSVDELFRADAKELLAARLGQHPDRFALTRALGEAFCGRREGQPLRTEDVERALAHHGLLEDLAKREREAVLGAYAEHRGATGRVAWALGLTLPEVHRLVRALGIFREVEDIRERYRREALSGKHLGQRLDLLGRGKYLADLGIRRRFDEALRTDLRRVLSQHAAGAKDMEELLTQAARSEGTQAELLQRAVEKLELTGELQQLLVQTERR